MLHLWCGSYATCESRGSVCDLRPSAQSLGMPIEWKREGRSQGSSGHWQEQDDSSGGAESAAPDVASEHDLERAMVPFPEVSVAERYNEGDNQIMYNPDKVSLGNPADLADSDPPVSAATWKIYPSCLQD